MKTRSRKIKSKRLSNYVRKKILKAFPHLKQKDVMLPKDGQTGPDLFCLKMQRSSYSINLSSKTRRRCTHYISGLNRPVRIQSQILWLFVNVMALIPWQLQIWITLQISLNKTHHTPIYLISLFKSPYEPFGKQLLFCFTLVRLVCLVRPQVYQRVDNTDHTT